MSIFYIPHINFNHSQRNNPLLSTPAAKQTRIAMYRAQASYLMESEGHFGRWAVPFWQVPKQQVGNGDLLENTLITCTYYFIYSALVSSHTIRMNIRVTKHVSSFFVGLYVLELVVRKICISYTYVDIIF